MNIHFIYQLFWCSPGVQGFDPSPYIYIHIYNIIWQSLSRWLVWSENHVLLIDSPVSTCFHCSNLRHFASNASVQIHRYSALHVSGARKKEAGSLRRRGPWWDFVAARRCLFILNLFQVLPTYQERIVTSYIRVCGWKLLLWNPLMSLIFSYLLLSTYTKWAVFKTLLVCDYRGLYYQIIPT